MIQTALAQEGALLVDLLVETRPTTTSSQQDDSQFDENGGGDHAGGGVDIA